MLILVIENKFKYFLPWVDNEKFKVYEDFIGFYEEYNIKTTTIVHVITDTLIRLNLSISRCRNETND